MTAAAGAALWALSAALVAALAYARGHRAERLRKAGTATLRSGERRPPGFRPWRFRWRPRVCVECGYETWRGWAFLLPNKERAAHSLNCRTGGLMCSGLGGHEHDRPCRCGANTPVVCRSCAGLDPSEAREWVARKQGLIDA